MSEQELPSDEIDAQRSPSQGAQKSVERDQPVLANLQAWIPAVVSAKWIVARRLTAQALVSLQSTRFAKPVLRFYSGSIDRGKYLLGRWPFSEPREPYRVPAKTGQTEVRWLLALMLGIALLLSSSVTWVVKKLGTVNELQSRSLPFVVTAHPKLIIYDAAGVIHIQSRGSGPIMIQSLQSVSGVGTIFNDTQVNYSQHGDLVQVNASFAKDLFFWGEKSIDLNATVPVMTDIEVHTGSGTISLSGIHGDVKAETDAGSIILNNTVGTVALTTQSGQIDVRRATLHAPSLLKTKDGSIIFNGALDRHGSYSFVATNGSVDVTLPAVSAFRLNTGDGSGSLSNAFKSMNVGKGPQAWLSLSTRHAPIIVRKGS